jgi:probable HAF family extracellular repeat protein
MKPLATITFLWALSLGPTLGYAQEQSGTQKQKPQQVRYAVTDLGPVGGPPGQPITITSSGLISGVAAMPDGTEHAILWYKGLEADIGTHGLGGLNSVAFGGNDSVQAVGEAETSTPDPNGEDFCGFRALGLPSAGSTCLPFLWQNGVMNPLPTLGGNNGAANQINNRGEAAGVAENSTADTACPAPQVLQFKPVIWKRGAVTELRTVAEDPDGVAFAINDNGQAVGGSGVCAPFSQQLYINLQSLHALLWQKGKVTDLGNLGGDGYGFGNLALNVNSSGQAVGFSDLAGDAGFHGFLWSKTTGMQDLGTLPGDANSSAVGINDAGEVVGISLDANFNPRAFVRRNGRMKDLNALVPGDSPLFLLLACSINSHGEIIGLAVEKSTGEAHGFLAIPKHDEARGESAEQVRSYESRPFAVSENVREILQQRLRFGRFGPRLVEPR